MDDLLSKVGKQPDPVRSGTNVPEAFQRWARDNGFDDAERLSIRRDRFGREKYGQPLMSGDRRDSVIDALEEIGDLNHYVFKAILNGEDTAPLRGMLAVVLTLLDHGDMKKILHNN